MRASTSTGDVAASLAPPTRLHGRAVEDLSAAIRAMLADTFALFMKTKNFHWHMSGPHFRDWHLLLDEQADQIYAVIDPLAERVRKIGGLALRSVGDIQQHQRILDNDEDHVDPHQMLAELRDDHRDFV